MEQSSMYRPETSSQGLREFTLRALLIGLVLAVVLGAANAYLGLKAGMTIAATYPAAVISMAVLRFFKGSLLEENFARTVGSIGESVAAGAIFTLPAFFIAGVWGGEEFSSWSSYMTASLILVTGGVLGVLFVALLRRVMVEDKELPFPESTAAAEIHKSGRSSTGDSKYLVWAMVGGALVTVGSALKLFASSAKAFFKVAIAKLTSGHTIEGGFYAAAPNVSPAFLGVGYIIGPRLASLNFSGSVVAWGLMVPLLLAVFGRDFVNGFAVDGVAPNSQEAWMLAANTVWQSVVRIVAIGGMLLAAIFTLYRMRSSLTTGLKRSVKDLRKAASESGEEVVRTEKDLKTSWVLAGIVLAAIATFCITYFIFKTTVLVAAVAATIMIVLAFFFSAVSGYLVGLIGSSNNPISGLTITALVITALILVLCGVDENTGGVAAVLGVAAIVCVAAAVAGEMFQDLKAGHILGGTPWKMQLGDIIGVVLSGFVMFGVLIILNNADIAMGGMQGYAGGFGSEALPAPQASLMAILSNAVVAGSMTWILIIAGMLLCVALILMGVKSPMLVFVGMYLPFQTVSAIFVGGLIKGLLDMRTAKMNYSPVQLAKVENTGILLASGMIAGEALMGLIIAIFALFNVFFSEMLPIEQPSYWIGLVLMFAMAYLMIVLPLKKAAKTNGQK